MATSFDWLSTLASNMQAISTIRAAHYIGRFPKTLKLTPAVVIVPTGGDQEYSKAGPGVAIHRVDLALYITNQIATVSYNKFPALHYAIRNALAADIQLGGNCKHCLPASPFYDGPGVLSYGEVPYVGATFHLIVKAVETITVSA